MATKGKTIIRLTLNYLIMEFKTYSKIDYKTGKEYPVHSMREIIFTDETKYGVPDNPLEKAEQIAKEASLLSGFPITEEAVEWQIKNWHFDYNSGYRDEKGGYHLFSHCGYNDFSIEISPLQEGLDWQITAYED